MRQLNSTYSKGIAFKLMSGFWWTTVNLDYILIVTNDLKGDCFQKATQIIILIQREYWKIQKNWIVIAASLLLSWLRLSSKLLILWPVSDEEWNSTVTVMIDKNTLILLYFDRINDTFLVHLCNISIRVFFVCWPFL